MSEDVIWLTEEAHQKLVEQLNYLKGEGRAEIAEKIARARDEGDLSENAGYHAAREEQGQIEARIRQLQATLEKAQVGEGKINTDVVSPGVKIKVEFPDIPNQTQTFILGSREMLKLLDDEDIMVYSPQSPMGAAIMGHHVGDTVTYKAPNGRDIRVKVLGIEN